MGAADYPFQIIVSEDRMQVHAQGAPWDQDPASLADQLHRALTEFRIRPVPDPEQLEALLRDATRDGEVCDRLLLVEGKPPVPPVDASLVWDGDFFSPGFAVDPETGRIDYRRRAAQPMVEAGRLLATLTPARAGVDGADVFGRRIRAERPVRRQVRGGRNVKTEELPDGTRIFRAAIAGRVRWDMKVISVDEVFRVAGDVDLNTGNIRHNGAVVIGGDIKNGFSVEATGDIEVCGMIEAADVHAGGNLIVHGGISGGRGTTCVRAAGNLHARYILDASVEVGGEARIEKEIVNSEVCCERELKMPRGTVVGGAVRVWSGLTIAGAGSPRATPTLLAAGVNPLLERRIEEKRELIARYRAELERIQEATAPYIEGTGSLDDTRRAAFIELLTRSAVCDHLTGEHTAELEELETRLREPVHPVIRVVDQVHCDCRIRLRQATMLLQRAMVGPLRFHLHEGEVRFFVERDA